ncbi:MAG TPA: choice-of-anchor V domain-containing protein [Paludibaculum sp.]|jgi:hypothetical protein
MIKKLGLCAVVLASVVWAHSTGAPAGASGVPGEGDCTDCHGGVLNSGSGNVSVSLVNGTTWTPGQQVRVRITLADPTARRWGFQITARSASDQNTNAGVFALADSTLTRIAPGSVGAAFITHTALGTSPGTAGPSTWDVLWTPPADVNFGAVKFYAAGNAANNNNTNDAGDKIYTTTLTVNPAGAANTTSYALSQLAFGEGWYTAVYLTNANTSSASATLNYFGADGNPLNIANVGTSTTLNLGPKGTAIVEAADLGPLTQGWIEAKLPDGVTGYGVFRQTVGGRPQEAVVPLANTVSTSGSFIFDETNYVTAAAFMNYGTASANITVTIRDVDGSTIGANSLSLAPKARTAVVVKSLASLAGMVGKRGTVEFTSTAPITVLGLRFNGEAFTSIPAVQK